MTTRTMQAAQVEKARIPLVLKAIDLPTLRLLAKGRRGWPQA